MVINSQRQNAGAAHVKPVALKRSLHVELVLRLSLSLSIFLYLSLSLSLSFGNSQIFLKWIKFYVYLFVFFCQNFSISYYLFSLLSQALLFLSLAFAWLFQYYCSAKL